MPSKTCSLSTVETTSRATKKYRATQVRSESLLTPTGTACAFDFTAETPRPRQSAYVAASTPCSHLPLEASCASTNHAAHLIGREQKILLYLLAEPAAEHPNVIPFPRDQIHSRFRSHPDSAHNLSGNLDRTARNKPATQYARPWQVIDGGGK